MQAHISQKLSRGSGLVEIVIGAAVFLTVALAVSQSFTTMLNSVRFSRAKITAAALANEEFEIARNLPFSLVGISGGFPTGSIPHLQTLTRDGNSFAITTTVRNVDDPFDGTVGGTPNDSAPADYKIVEMDIDCTTCKIFPTQSFSSFVAPKNLEGAATNGSLFVQVFNASGQPIPDADVHIVNSSSSPTITIDDTTNNSGLLQEIGIPPGNFVYKITVSKAGYSTDQTYAASSTNPNPSKPHATVAVQQVTQASFSIDQTSTLNASTVTASCVAVPSLPFSLSGSKLIGTNPNVLKYSKNFSTDGLGARQIAGLEWDSYNPLLTDAANDLAGTIPLLPLNIAPGATQAFKFIVQAKNPRSLLATIKDGATQLPLTGATVTLTQAGNSTSLVTGQGFFTQTDWSGGNGQASFSDPKKFLSSDGNIDGTTVPGQITLTKTAGNYSSSGVLTSSTFDTGSPSNFYSLSWLPQDQATSTGADSVRFQLATNNDGATWNYVGPDGTSGTYYTTGNANISATHNGTQFLRYKAYLQTANSTSSPNVSNVSFTYTSACVPPGQAFFSGMGSGTYSVTVSAPGYSTYSGTVDLSSSWQQIQVSMTP